MASFTLSKTSTTLFNNKSVSAGGTESATLDLRTCHGGTVSVQLKNGGTGPTLAASVYVAYRTLAASVYVAYSHNSSSTPSASATFGSDWFLAATLAGTTVANDVRNFPTIIIPPGVQHMEVVVTDNTGQAVTVNAKATLVTSVVSA